MKTRRLTAARPIVQAHTEAIFQHWSLQAPSILTVDLEVAEAVVKSVVQYIDFL